MSPCGGSPKWMSRKLHSHLKLLYRHFMMRSEPEIKPKLNLKPQFVSACLGARTNKESHSPEP